MILKMHSNGNYIRLFLCFMPFFPLTYKREVKKTQQVAYDEQAYFTNCSIVMLRSLLKHAKLFQLYKLHCKDYFSIKFKALGSNAFESLLCFKGCFSFLLFSFLFESTVRAQLRCFPLQSLSLYFIIFFITTVGWHLQCFPFEIICFSYNLIHQFCAF